MTADNDDTVTLIGGGLGTLNNLYLRQTTHVFASVSMTFCLQDYPESRD